MATSWRRLVIGGGVVAVLVAPGCSGGDDDPSGAEPSPTTTERTEATEATESPTTTEPTAPATTGPATTSGPGPGTDPGTVPLPDAVGMDLQLAQDTMQAAGFYLLTSHDATGQERLQVLDRNWTVCDQSPAAGTPTATDVVVDFAAVKDGEACPS